MKREIKDNLSENDSEITEKKNSKVFEEEARYVDVLVLSVCFITGNYKTYY